MSTRSNIGKKLEDGRVRFIYCHSDGYPEGVGQILQDYYNSDNIDGLLDLGDASFIGEDYDSCFFYGRDRGEKNCDARVADSVEDYFHNSNDWYIEYKYLLDTDGRWYCMAVDYALHNTKVEPLETLLNK